MVNQLPVHLHPAAGPFAELRRLLPTDRLSGLVNDADFAAANSIMAAASLGAPLALAVGASELVGRAAAGNIASLTAAQVRTILSVTSGAEPNAASQLNAGAAGNILSALGPGALTFRGLETSTGTILTITQTANDVTLAILPSGIILTDLGDVTAGQSPGDVLEWDGLAWAPVPNAGGGGLAAVVDDLSPELGGNLDVLTRSIVSSGANPVTIAPVSGQDMVVTTAGGGDIVLNGNPVLPVNTGTPTQGQIIYHDGAEYTVLPIGATQQALRVSSGGVPVWSTNTKPQAVTFRSLVGSDEETMFHTPVALTGVRVGWVLRGAAANADFALRRDTDRSAAGTVMMTQVGQTSQAGLNSGTFAVASIPAGSFVWVEGTQNSGTVDELHVTLSYTEDV